MRINVYSQELTGEVEIVEKRPSATEHFTTDGDHYREGHAPDPARVFRGIRLYLASPDVLHHTADDDDRSAITFWIPHSGTYSPRDLARAFLTMAESVINAEPSYFPTHSAAQEAIDRMRETVGT